MLFQNGIGEIRPFALADRFEPSGLRRQVQAADTGKQAYMGQCNVDFVGHLLVLGIRKPASFFEAGCYCLSLFDCMNVSKSGTSFRKSRVVGLHGLRGMLRYTVARSS